MAFKIHYIPLFLLFQVAFIKVMATPKVSFTVSSTSGCSPLSENFTNFTSGGTAPYTYLWELGNSNTSTLKDASAIYYAPGKYKITLIVTDAKGNVDSTSKTITVFKNPTADFSVDNQVGCPPMKATFTDQSTGGSAGIAKWLWDFGDGSTSTSQNPGPHTYSRPGKYDISLLVTDSNGCSAHVVRSGYVIVDQPPSVSFSASSNYACNPPFTVNFSSTVSPSKKVSYAWDFGDGTTGTGATPSKTYTSKGSFDVTLTVTDSLGCKSTVKLQNFIYIGNPVAAFTESAKGGCAPLLVQFTDATTGAPPGSKYNWNFGDGSSSTDQNPSHTFPVGSYTITLIVTTPGGCADTVIFHNINVSKPYVPSFIGDSVICQAPFKGTFTNTTGSWTRAISWNFGDKSAAGYGENITHTFPKDGGFYSVTLEVVDTNGCEETVTKSNFVHSGLTVAQFYPDQFKGCAPLKINFDNASFSIDSIISELWDFGDGTTSYQFNPPGHLYRYEGTYTITLTIKTLHGCTSTYFQKIKLGVKPKANFISFPDSGCLNMLRNVHFINLTNVNAAVLADSFTWFFNTDKYGTNSDSPITWRFEEPPGTYPVTLIAYNNKSCPDTLVKGSLIIVKPPYALYGVKRDTCVFQNILTFVDASIGASHVEYYFGDGDSSDQRNPTHTYLDSGMYQPCQVAYDSSNGCSDTFFYFERCPAICGLYIKPPWKDTIQALSATLGCSPFTVRFRIFDNDTAINRIIWGDGDTSGFASPFMYSPTLFLDTLTVTHTYLKPGIYTVSMHEVNDQGCRDTFQMNPKITVLGLKAAFTVSSKKGCVPLTVTLYDSFPNIAGINKSYYLMGNGDSISTTSQTMTYTYTKPPPDQRKGFRIKLVVGNISCTDTAFGYAYPIQPTGVIDAFNASSCDSVAYQFVSEPKGIAPFKYLWNFGNGDTVVGSQSAHTFGVGSNRVKLRITDSLGCTDTLSMPILVQSTRDSASFVIKLSSGNCPPITAYFIDSSKFAIPGPHKWFWDFGDGSTSTLENPSKVYYTAGSFTVTLKITDILGCTSEVIKLNVIFIKGPTGEYTVDPLLGCAPLVVHFKAASSNATKFAWDFGDGSPFGSSDTATHIYKSAGKYIPSLVLGDNSCTYPLPPKDTIIVNALPIPAFGYDSTCSGQPLHFTDQSVSNGKIVRWIWNFGDGSIESSKQNPTHIYTKNGFYPVKLNVTNNSGCSNSVSNSVKYGDIIARFSVAKTGCLGSPVQFFDKTISDSAIKSWLWLFGDGTTSSLQNPTHVYNKKGVYPISLYVQNYKGCYDSLKNGAYIIIGDTVPPQPPKVYRVTVLDDHNVEIDFSENRDFDFQKYLIYMRDESGKSVLIDSVFFAADTIRIIGGLNNLHHSFCFLVQAVNQCGYHSDSLTSLYHCTIRLDASPGINQAILNWTPYQGWPVSQYKIYRQQNESPPAFNILDSVPGTQLKYIDTSIICYQPMIYRVEGFEKNGNKMVSWSDTAATIPIHVPHVPPAEMLRATVENNKTTLVEWKMVPNGHIKNWMLEKSSDGVNFYAMDTPIACYVLSEPDKDVDVQTNSYTYRLRILDSCGDLGPYSEIGKTILLSIDTTQDVKPSLIWTAYKNWPEGVQYYDIYIEGTDKVFNWLARTNSGQDTVFIDNLTDLNSLPNYTYHVQAHRNGTLLNPNINLGITSLSNDATLRPHSRLFVPNVFTPNGDGINDSFFVQGLFIKEFHMKIFDRWGTKVFESGSMKDKWSGSYKGGPPVMDAYKYLIYYRGVDNIERYTDGWVTILE